MNSNTKIPVIVITGFLGSGKTTLLNRLIAAHPKTALIINEFGATPIDPDLLQQSGLPLTVLSGGCLCCKVKGALAPTLKNLWMAWDQAETKPFERIIVETSGIASPEPILDTLLRERWLASRYRLEAVVTTLAIPSAVEQLERFAEARAQVAWADTLLLTHADLSNADQRAALETRLQAFAPATPRQVATAENYRLADLPAKVSPALRRLPDGSPLPAHNFRSLSLYLDRALPWPQLQTTLRELLARHAQQLLRIKGVVYLAEQSAAVVIQAAGARLYPPVGIASGTANDDRGRLVFIVDGDPTPLAEDIGSAFGPLLGDNAIKLH